MNCLKVRVFVCGVVFVCVLCVCCLKYVCVFCM